MSNVFEYADYRNYLRAVFLEKKSKNTRFSYRVFSRLAGFSSPNFLKLVIEGQRNLSSESIAKISAALKHNRESASFFRHLVLMNQATSAEERNSHAEQVLKSRHYRQHHPLSRERYEYYSRWYVVAVRELVDTKGFQEDPDWIARTVTPSITVTEATQALEILKRLELVASNENGKLVQTSRIVSAGDEVASVALAEFHRQMIDKGREAIDRFPSHERDISSVTLGLSAANVIKVKELIQRFRKQLLEIAEHDAHATQVYEVNFQYFPLSKGEKEGNES
ncbi:MAG: hypothetical protein A2X94_15315 [Bdellovibrionales bacterium GWB1_55_8]|nr:MAG: hypothetical protein A2X94_15315 [Bdellovibrionales bacterium GWB1_55_8]